MISSKLHSEITGILDALELGEELFWQPVRQVTPGAWTGHLAIAFWLVKATQPSMFVELGTHSGNSYSAFCQAIAHFGLPTRAFAVDTWLGDEHSGLYSEEVFQDFHAFNENHFSRFSKLSRTTFDDARSYFPDSSIDLLHIDGLHAYEAVKHDFDTWSSALSPSAIVVFHDTNVRAREFGVWKLWQELAENYPSFEFHHSEGLGVLGFGANLPPLLRCLFELGRDPQSAAIVRRIFAARGEAFVNRSRVLDLTDQVTALSNQVGEQSHRVSKLEHDLASQDVALRDRLQEVYAQSESISILKQDLVGRDASLVDREQEIRAKAELINDLQRQLVDSEATLRNREQKIRAKAELINDLQRHLVDSEATLRNREQKIASQDKLLSATQRKIAELEECVTPQREQLAALARSLDEERSTAAQQIESLQDELAGVRKTLGLIEASAAWKLVSRLRSAFQPYPKVRLYCRRLARIIWWTVTFQLFDRLRDRRQLLHMRDLIARSALFDASWYIAQSPGVAEFGDPALHYALFGAKEGRNPSPHFDVQDYLERYPDVAEYGMNPLVHYLEYGASEGRKVSPIGESEESAQSVTQPPAEKPNRDYATWVSCYDSLTQEDRTAIASHIALLRDRPLISIVMPVFNTNTKFLRSALDSVLAQLYPNWELCIADDASTNPEVRTILTDYAEKDTRIKVVFRPVNGNISVASNSALSLAQGSFIALMDHDDELSEHALYMVALELDAHHNADIIYSDEDKIDARGVRQTPYFKPNWNRELFYSQNYLNHLIVYRASLVKSAGGFRLGYEGSQDFDLALRVTGLTGADRICHIPHVLYHWRTVAGISTFSNDNLPTAVAASRRALLDYFAANGEEVRVEGSRLRHYNRVVRLLPDPEPFVSLIIPTRDHLHLLKGCIAGLLNRTAYRSFEVIVVDNDSSDRETLNYLNDLQKLSKIRIIHGQGEFNYSALNNCAVAAAQGDLIGLLNNDLDVIHPEWLGEMAAQLARPEVGAVGAKLYYSDDTIQHAGVTLGVGGVAGHSHRHFARADEGYFGRLQLVHEVSCVTAACMLVKRTVFERVGGFDESNLTVAFNDVDLCLKIREAGYKIIWTPYAELYHKESASRGSDEVPEKLVRASLERECMKQRWADVLFNDPYYNPNLTLEHEDYSLAFPPRVTKPWHGEGLLPNRPLATSQYSDGVIQTEI
jgi:glycosyltransferase involved in cell wall biosynthesis